LICLKLLKERDWTIARVGKGKKINKFSRDGGCFRDFYVQEN
jgi:hypothetical protein